MKTYEAMILLDNREVKKGWEHLKESVDSILTRRGAEILVSKRWDERKLAYEIKKQRRATYYLSYLKTDPGGIDEIRRDLELSPPVLRYLILSCETIPEEAYEPEKEFTMVEEESEVESSSQAEAEDDSAEDDSAEDDSAEDDSAEDSKAGEGSEMPAPGEEADPPVRVAQASEVPASTETHPAEEGKGDQSVGDPQPHTVKETEEKE